MHENGSIFWIDQGGWTLVSHVRYRGHEVEICLLTLTKLFYSQKNSLLSCLIICQYVQEEVNKYGSNLRCTVYRQRELSIHCEKSLHVRYRGHEVEICLLTLTKLYYSQKNSLLSYLIICQYVLEQVNKSGSNLQCTVYQQRELRIHCEKSLHV